MKYLVTGSAGFIGFHVAKRLLAAGDTVVGIDCFSDYYDPQLKRSRTELLSAYATFESIESNLSDRATYQLLKPYGRFDAVIHLAAQAGVRHSLTNPGDYVSANVVGSWMLLEYLKEQPPAHAILASTSSVYGDGRREPFKESSDTSSPASFYAATKKSMEVMARAYSHTAGIPTTIARLFTVYGPWGRPDMALFAFVKNILRGDSITVYGNGELTRDYTYVADVVEALTRLIAIPPAGPVAAGSTCRPSGAKFRVVNVGQGSPVVLRDFVAAIERDLGVEARVDCAPVSVADVTDTCADPSALLDLVGPIAWTPLEEGIHDFVEWYLRWSGDGVGR